MRDEKAAKWYEKNKLQCCSRVGFYYILDCHRRFRDMTAEVVHQQCHRYGKSFCYSSTVQMQTSIDSLHLAFHPPYVLVLCQTRRFSTGTAFFI
mmetsp:Transcript_4799/g.12593  ORF Transcript_4799/g.12593 Transcript_4799/m.12593 type:complete len:94 (-) Transcript_4799:742-1023(-)